MSTTAKRHISPVPAPLQAVPRPARVRREREPVEKLAYSVAEAAEALGITETHMRKLVAVGTFPAIRLGTRLVLHREELERVLRDMQRYAGKESD